MSGRGREEKALLTRLGRRSQPSEKKVPFFPGIRIFGGGRKAPLGDILKGGKGSSRGYSDKKVRAKTRRREKGLERKPAFFLFISSLLRENEKIQTGKLSKIARRFFVFTLSFM